MRKSVLAAACAVGLLLALVLGSTSPSGAGVTAEEGLIFLSSTSSGNVGGVAFADDDVVVYDIESGEWYLAFDGSDVGLNTTDIDAFTVINPFDPLVLDFSIAGPKNLPGLGVVDDSDVLRFIGQGGPDTEGDLQILIDGSDVELTTSAEDIDAMGQAPGGLFLFSTVGTTNVTGVTAADEDIFLFTALQLGPGTVGDYEPFIIDGSDFGMAREDISALDLGVGELLYASALGNYSFANFTGDSDDVFVFTGEFVDDPQLATAVLFFDGDQHGFGGEQIDGLSVWNIDPTTPQVELSVGFNGAPAGPVTAGDQFILELNVRLGPPTPVDPILEFVVPPGLEVGAPLFCEPTPQGFSCPLPSIDDQLVLQLPIGVQPGFAGTSTLEASIMSSSLEQRLSNNTDSVEIEIVGPPVDPGKRLFLSSTTGGSVGGVSFADEDALLFDPNDLTWSMAFDGSDMGLAKADIDGFAILSEDPFVMDFSLSAPFSVPGIGMVDDSDVLRFAGTGGTDTAGSFAVVFDGSDVELDIASEDIDAVDAVASCVAYLFSTSGNVNGTPLTARDEDYLAFAAATLGETTAGSFEVAFDGSDVGLAVEDLVGVTYDEDGNLLYGAGLGNYAFAGFSGDRDDVFVFAGTLGPDTSGTAALVFDGDMHGFGTEQIDGLHVDIPRSNDEAPDCNQENQPPTIFEPSLDDATQVSIPENTTAVTDVNTNDEDSEGSGLTYSLTTDVNGIDNEFFNLDATTGVLSFINPPDFENPLDASVDGGDEGATNTYEAEVTVTDSGGLTDTILITVAVTNVEELEPGITIVKEISIDGGTTFATSTPPNLLLVPLLTDVQFRLSVTNSGDIDFASVEVVDNPLNISAQIGALLVGQTTVVDSGDIAGLAVTDYCPTTGFAVNAATATGTVAGTGDGAAAASEVIVQCVDVPPMIISPAAVSVPEGTTLVPGIVDATDDLNSEGSGLTFSKAGGADQDLFNLDPSSGDVSFITAPDFETPDDMDGNRIYELQVTVTDEANNQTTQLIAITVTDVVEVEASMSLTYQLSINGGPPIDADSGPGIEIESGSMVIFSANVTNTGTDTLTSVAITAPSIDFVSGSLVPGAGAGIGGSRMVTCDEPGVVEDVAIATATGFVTGTPLTEMNSVFYTCVLQPG